MLGHRHRTCLPHDAVSVGEAASSHNWEVPGLLSRRSQKSTYTGRTAAWGCPGGSSRSPANPPLQEEGWGEQGSHTQTHSRAGPPLQWDEPGPTCVQTRSPRSPRTPLRTGGTAAFLPGELQPQAKDPATGCGGDLGPPFSGCPSVPPMLRTDGCTGPPSPTGTARLVCRASNVSRSPALHPLPAPWPRGKEPGRAHRVPPPSWMPRRGCSPVSLGRKKPCRM